MSSNPNYRSPVLAAIATSIVMLVFAVTYRVWAGRVCAPLNMTPVDPAAMTELPLQIGEWTGQEVPLDEFTARATGADAYISRRYSRSSGLMSASLYIVCGVRVHDIMYHRPDVCYVQNGWKLMEARSIRLAVGNGMTVPCRILQFSRDALQSQRIAVLHYYVVDRQVFSCLSDALLRARNARNYVAQVQITTSAGPVCSESDTGVVSDFAVASTPLVFQLFANLDTGREKEGETRSMKVEE